MQRQTLIKDRIKYIRSKFNLTQKKFAEKLETSAGYICEIEKGEKIPGSEFLIRLKQKFNVNINWLLTGEGEMFLSERESLVGEKEDETLREIIEFLTDFWRNASDKERAWLEVQFSRCFQEFELYKKKRETSAA